MSLKKFKVIYVGFEKNTYSTIVEAENEEDVTEELISKKKSKLIESSCEEYIIDEINEI